ncbi:MAG: bile acid:sodium symporter, partial [Verrucomicrobia bacterium]|nr:bile acid:sodium symporter [Verrucomicrobiota bacterium]
MKPGHFVAGIFIALISAFIIPDLGSSGGILMPHVSGPGATFLIFLIQGLQLKGGALREVWTSWRLHAACQIANFVLAPWIFVALERIFGWWIIDDSL